MRPEFFSSPWGVQVHPLHPWLRLCHKLLNTITSDVTKGKGEKGRGRVRPPRVVPPRRRPWAHAGFFPGVGKFIGVARIFHGVHFSLEKVTTFLVAALKIHAKLLNKPLSPAKKLRK